MEDICIICHQPIEEINIVAYKQGKCFKCYKKTAQKRVWDENKKTFVSFYKIICKNCGKEDYKRKIDQEFCSNECSKLYSKKNGLGWFKGIDKC